MCNLNESLCIVWVLYLNGTKKTNVIRAYFVNGLQEAHEIVEKMVHTCSIFYDIEILNTNTDAKNMKPWEYRYNKKLKDYKKI